MDIHQDQVPLRKDETGVIRVGDSRMHFEFVVRAFEDGVDPETIVQMYRGLDLADAYAVIAYYLRHREEVRAWLEEQDRAADEMRQKVEAAQGPLRVTRKMLKVRWEALEKQRAAADQR